MGCLKSGRCVQASLVVASPEVVLACSMAPVESLHFPFHFHSALKAGQALQESLLASALSGAPWWWIRETHSLGSSAALHTFT